MSSAAAPLRFIPFPVLLGAGAVLALAAIGYVAARRAAATGALNPLSDKNIFYQGASSLTEALTGVRGDTPGFALHRFVNPEFENWDPNAPVYRDRRIWVEGPLFGPALPEPDPWLVVQPFGA